MAQDLRTGSTLEADLALARSLVYRLLSQAFAYPTPEAVEGLRDQDLPLAVSFADVLPEPVRATLEGAAAAYAAADPGELEAAYRDLFSHVHSADCPMYETDFTARDVWRQANELADLAGFYRAFGVEQRAERPDHVSAELEFLHVVSYKAAWAMAMDEEDHVEVCTAAERAFLRDHALRWLPGFAARVEALAVGETYLSVAQLATAFLRSEAEVHHLEVPADLEPAAEPPAEPEVPSLCEADP